MTIIIKNRQTIFDIALQYCGDREAAFAISELNNIAVTEYVEPGTAISIPAVINQKVVDYYSQNSIEPSTEIEPADTLLKTITGKEIIRRINNLEAYTIKIQ